MTAQPQSWCGGYLWQREGITRGGEPRWAEVNTFRQRAAMRPGPCQICGTKIDARPISWLVPSQLV